MGNGSRAVRLSAADTVILALCGIFTSLARLIHSRAPAWAELTGFDGMMLKRLTDAIGSEEVP